MTTSENDNLVEETSRRDLEQLIKKILKEERQNDLEPLIQKYFDEENKKDAEPLIARVELQGKKDVQRNDQGDEEDGDLEPFVKTLLMESKMKDELETRDTGTIHMLAVTEVTKTQDRCTLRPWFFALMSFCFVMIQSAAFYMMIYEYERLPCSAHTDCLTGQYCKMYDRSDTRAQSLCEECEDLTLMLTTLSEIKNATDKDWNSRMHSSNNCSKEEITNLESVDQSVVWFNEYGYPQYNRTNFPDPNALECLALQHCRQSEKYMPADKKVTTIDEALAIASTINQCDYLVLVRNKLMGTQAFVFICLIFIIAAHMSNDIEEATIEEALLRKRGATMSNFPALILLVSLRHRRLVLPWGMAMAVVVITLTDDLSIKNILLNVVALEFILNADSLFLKYCFSRAPKSRDILHEDDNDHSTENIEPAVMEGMDYSWWGPRVESFSLGLVMIITVLDIRSEVDFLNDIFFGSSNDVGCELLSDALWLIMFYGSLLTCIVHSLCHLGTLMRVPIDKCLTSITATATRADRTLTVHEPEYSSPDEIDERVEEVKGRLLFIVADTLFQSMASLCALFLFSGLTYLIAIAYFSPQELLPDDPFPTVGILAVVFLCTYFILALVMNSHSIKKMI